VWAKHLFNQLFGEADADEDVSPDTADPEATGDAGQSALQESSKGHGDVDRVSTRAWAMSTGYNPDAIFNKLFHDDIKYLLSMDKLWQTRRPPTPLVATNLPDVVAGSSKAPDEVGVKDQRVWSVKECAEVFSKCVERLQVQLEALADGDILVWDKDDDVSMDFVTACANIRAHIFGIPTKSRFDVKSMAGNIIPAIATTNAIVAGVIVMIALRIIEGRTEECKTIYLKTQANAKNKLLVPCVLDKPNPTCYVCSSKPEVSVKLDMKTFTLKMLEEKVLKTQLNMVAPDVEIDDGKGTIIISSEEGETTDNNNKTLEEMNLRHGTRLRCDDFLQNYQLIVNVLQCDKLDDKQEFELIGDMSKMQAQSEETSVTNGEAGSSSSSGEPRPGPSTVVDDEDDVILMDEDDESEPPTAKKRKAGDGDGPLGVSKKLKVAPPTEDDEIMLL
jgi:ubiquitin-like 1-activating enzyme E1 B